jgi:stage II sporulation protein D
MLKKGTGFFVKKRFRRCAVPVALFFCLPYVLLYASGQGRESYALQKAAEHYISIQTDTGIREIAFEDYACGVAARSLEEDVPLEAAKAQMVIARTNLEKQLEDHPGQLLSEAYLTLEELDKKGMLTNMLQAMEETSGQVLKVDGALVYAPFHGVSSGRTRSGWEAGLEGYEWLTGVESLEDTNARWYLAEQTFSWEALKQRLTEGLQEDGDVQIQNLQESLYILERDSSGYVTKIQVGKMEISGERFRKILGLSSSCFYLEKEESLKITTKGLGHGLGMSLYGADCMARAGNDYRRILEYYFPGCAIMMLGSKGILLPN